MKNQFKVPLKKWNKWSIVAKGTFNKLFAELKVNQKILLHPQVPIVSNRKWFTICWNASWLAADNVDATLKEISKGVM